MAASTFVASGTYTTPAGAAATGVVTFIANNDREINTATIQDKQLVTATLANGVLSQVLVINVGGYNVTEKITNSPEISYVIPGVSNINLSTVDASTANFDASGVVNVTPPDPVSGTSYTFTLDDGASIVKRFTAATAITATIDGSAPIPVGTTILWRQAGAGQINFTGTNGALIRAVGLVTHSQGQWSQGSLTKDTSTVWILAGEIG